MRAGMNKMESYEAKIARRKRFQRVVSMLCCICVFITTYALILPAITMEAEADCGIKEHTHGDECYAWSEQSSIVCDEGHMHTSTCYDEAGTLICGKEEVIVVHTHDALCYDASGALICGLPEVAEHTHTDECYESIPSEPKCICEKEEDEHEHSDACRLICELSDEEEHVHTDACLGDVLVCELTETDGHTHGEECYGEAVLTCDASKHEHTDECHAGELICEQDGIDGHEHTPACYALSCEESKHEHTDECYTKPLICTLDECEPHTHIDTCYERKNVCGVEEGEVHTHSEECYGEECVCGHECHKHTDECYEASEPTRGALTCTKQEIVLHTHSDECYADVDGVRTLVCTQPIVIAHQHTADCIHTDSVRGDLTCELTEHAHTSTCWESYYTLPAGSDDDDDDYFDDDYDPDLEGYAEDVGAGMPATLEGSSPIHSSNLSDYKSLKENVEGDNISVTVKTAQYKDGTFVSYLTLGYNFAAQALGQDGTYDLEYFLKLSEKMSVADLSVWRSAKDIKYSQYLKDNKRDDENAFDFCFVKVEGTDEYYILIEYTKGYAKYVEELKSPTDGTLSFSATIGKYTVNDEGDVIVPWENGTGDTFTIDKDKVTYPDNTTARADIRTWKNGSYDAKTKTLTYTVWVSTDKGTGEKINFVDGMPKLDNVSLATPTMEVKKYSAENSQTGSSVSVNPTFSEIPEADGTISKQISMELEKLNAGEKYEITYKYTNVDVTKAGSYNQKNNVTVSAEPNGDHIESKGESWVQINKELVKKSGVYDKGSQKINWVIKVNEDQNNIGGYTLEDSLFSGLKESEIQITSDVSNSDYTVNLDTNGYVTGITFNGNTNTHTYTITYSTSHAQTNTNQKIENTVVIKKDDKDKDEKKFTVDVPAVGVLKSGEFTSDYTQINWSITLDINNNVIPNGTVIQDISGSNGSVSKKHGLTKVQREALVTKLNALFKSANYTIQYVTDAEQYGNPIWTDASAVSDSAMVYGWKVTLSCDITGLDDSISIQYSTTPDFAEGNEFYNYVRYGDSDTTEKVKKESRISKLNGDGNTETKVITNTDGTLQWMIKIDVHSGDDILKITDFIPEGLVIKDVGIGWNTYSNVGSFSTTPTQFVTVADYKWVGGALYTAEVTKEPYTIQEASGADPAVTGDKLTFTITPYEYDGTTRKRFVCNEELWLSIKCQVTPQYIAKVLEEGETDDILFTNIATFEQEQSSQTQKLKWKRDVSVLKYDAKHDSNADDHSTSFDYNAKDNTLAWYVRIHLEDDYTFTNDNPLSITETLPTGVTLKTAGIALTAENAKLKANQFASGNASGEVKAAYTISETNASVYNIKIADNQTFVAGSYIYLYIECVINTDTEFNGENNTHAFENRASVDFDGKPTKEVSQTQTVTKKGNEEHLIKTSERSDETIDYRVVINGKPETLNGGSAINFTDTLTYNTGTYSLLAVLDPSSVSVWTAKYNEKTGQYDEDSKLDTSLWEWKYSYQTPTGNNQTHTHTIEGKIPDGQTLILKYTYYLNFDNTVDISGAKIENRFSMSGKGNTSDSSEDFLTWKANTPVGSANSLGTLPFYKIESNNPQKLLNGAVFSVYQYIDGKKDDKMVDLITGINEQGEKGTDGFVSIKNAYIDIDDEHYHYNTLYYIVETKAPAGYVLNNPQRYYFYFPKTNSDGYDTLISLADKLKEQGANVYDLTYVYSPIYVENEPIKTTLTINKKWLAYDETDLTEGIPDEITIKLYRKVNDVKDESFEKEYTLKASDSWTISITDLPKYNSEGSPYDYYAVEQGLDTNKYELIQQHEWLEIDDQKNPEKQDGTLTLTNKEIKKGKITVKKEWGANTTEHGITVELWRFKTMNKGSTKDVGYQGGDVDYDLFNDGSYQKIVDSITLSNDNSFTYTWDNLTLCEDVEGMIYYYYYFVIERGTGYVKSYTTQEVATADQDDELVPLKFMTNGTITITNSLKTVDITVNKEWGDIYTSDRSDVTFKLMQVKTLVNADSGESISTSKYGDSVVVNFVDETKPMTYTWENLPAYELNGSGEIVANYTYYVVEDLGENSLFKPTYSNATTNTNGTETLTPITGNTDDNTITVTNSYAYNYTLPVTGGSGTQMFTITGAVLMVGCAMLLAFNKKRRRGA